MPTPAQNKRKGSQWETDIVKQFRALGVDAERLHLNGSEDEGDVVLRVNGKYHIVEAKNAKLQPTEFINQALVEADHFANHRSLPQSAVHPVVFVKRRGKGVMDGMALMPISEYVRLMKAGCK